MAAVNMNPEKTSWCFVTELNANAMITGHKTDSNTATIGKTIFETCVPPCNAKRRLMIVPAVITAKTFLLSKNLSSKADRKAKKSILRDEYLILILIPDSQ